MSASRPKRPRSVTILAAGVITIASLALLRLVTVIQQWAFLESLPGYSPFYIAISGLVWSAAGGLMSWGLWLGYAWAPSLAKITLPVYAIYYWFDRLVMSAHTSANAGFLLLATIASLVFCFWALSRKPSILYFGDRHERTP